MTQLLLNGRIHSPTHPDATALAVRGDTIAWLGSDAVAREQFPVPCPRRTRAAQRGRSPHRSAGRVGGLDPCGTTA